MTTTTVANGTERLRKFIRDSIEKKYKPEGMSSELFWEIYDLLHEVDSYNGTT